MTSPLPDRRKPRWTRERRRHMPRLLPLIAAVLALVVYFKDARAASMRGVTMKGAAFVQTRFTKGPLTEFTVKFDLPDTPNPRGWW